MLLAGAAYFSDAWKTLQIVTTALAFASSLLFFVIPESPRWFLATGTIDTFNAKRFSGVNINLENNIYFRQI